TARARTLAAIALYDHVPQVPQRELERLVRTWWERKISPALNDGRSVISRDDAYALFELLHAVRANTLLDLPDSLPHLFKHYPTDHLVSYYPAAFEGSDGEYYIGAEAKLGEPDVRLANLSRAAELAMVAFDTNAPYAQVLQGWLMHDRYMLHGTLGT